VGLFYIGLYLPPIEQNLNNPESGNRKITRINKALKELEDRFGPLLKDKIIAGNEKADNLASSLSKQPPKRPNLPLVGLPKYCPKALIYQSRE
jgi:hypothetical protein